MTTMTDQTPDVDVSFDGAVATVEIRRPPHNFFTIPLIQHLADAFEDLEADRRCHAIVLAAQGTAFCAGADFSNRDATPAQRSPRALNPLYN
jgi:enoyl-CoA hydratase/carnithine racemase